MTFTRRQFVSTAAAAPLVAAPGARRPNVILILTDDQDYGDLSLHGNTHLKTPHMDRIGTEGVQFTQFQVCPVCSPTRSSLMTGRYNYRTGIVDTFLGRSMMYPDEVTLAEMLGGAGYRTGIFGKWHLGDNYPMRAMDQGFQEALVHRGGGIGQASDPPGGGSYFDPVLFHNGKREQHQGYVTDVIFGAAAKWIESVRGRPFFTYITPNAPHAPLQVSDALVAPFRAMNLPEDTAKTYAMVANIDENIGRLHGKLQELGLDRDTIVIFMTDNGAAFRRYNAGMRGQKTTPYQGGIRVPCFVRWPARLTPRKVDRIAAHIDIAPTLLAACGVPQPKGVKLDGRNLLPLAEGKGGSWPDRMLFTQWHRGDEPVAFRACAVRTQQYKLVDGKELYDLAADPGEQKDIATEHPDVVARLRKGYEDWLRDVSSDRHFVPPRIFIGTEHENPVTLTRQDWRVPPDARPAVAAGWWEVDVKRAGNYDITVTFDPPPADGELTFELGATSGKAPVARGATECRLAAVPLPQGPGRLSAVVKSGNVVRGARYVDVRAV